ncbi:fatty acid desaturase [Glaciimonas sp. Gout2]|nr:fatty acid desaturase [Glaciimonas sp. Gout2]
MSFLLALLVPLFAIGAVYTHNEGIYLLVFLCCVPILDHLIGRTKFPAKVNNSAFASTVAFYIPHFFLILWVLLLFISIQYSAGVSPFRMTCMALMCGVVGAVAAAHAHELGHRSSRYSTTAANITYCIAGYPTYPITHPIHHAKVGIAHVGSAPAQGISFWQFLVPSYINGFLTAWRYETRLRGLDWRNRVMQRCVLTLLCVVVFSLLSGIYGFVLYVGQAVVVTFLLELIGYVQHYGLVRGTGHHRSEVAWDGDFWLSNRLLINNPLHNMHHKRPLLWYGHLRPSPLTLPAGYFTMIWLAMLPPFWCSVMDRRLAELTTQGFGHD